MKPIELTENHKSKLLEMCKILFPEYPNLTVRNSMEDFCMEQEDCFIELQESGENSRKDTIIHWFEFCMIHLAEKIIDNTENSKEYCDGIQLTNYEFKITNFPFRSKHLVDYLYEEFKKLEKYEK